MKLLTVALTGLVTLVAASPVETTTAAAASEYKNNGVYISTVEDRAVDGPSAKYVNNDKVTYHCNRDVWIIACPANGGGCATTEMCLVKCIENRRGAECSPATPEKRDVDSEANIDDKKTYECAKDRTGVLVCQFGFCQTDHYCNKGWKCRDKCTCCKKGSVSSQEIDDVEINETLKLDAADTMSPTSTDHSTRGTDAEALTVVDSNTLASRVAPCAPGTYTCQDNLSTGTAWIVVCNSKGTWQYSADCGDMKCIAQSNGVAHCWNPGPEWDLSPSVSKREAACMPGTYNCQQNPSTSTAWIVVCDSRGKWVYSADCSDMKCLAQSNGVAHCWNPGPEWDLTAPSVSRREEPQDFAMAPLEGVCQTELYSCGYDATTDTAWIIVCDANETWQWLRPCGQHMKCSVSPPGSGNVQCLPMEALGARDESEQVPPDAAPSLTCRPRSYACAHRVSTNSSWVITCDQAGRTWLWSSDCGKNQVCDQSGQEGTAHCIPGPGLTLGVRDEPSEVQQELALSVVCTPGSFACAYSKSSETPWVIVCDQSGDRWLWSWHCDKGMKCKHGNGSAYCIPDPSLTLGARHEGSEVPLELAPSVECTPGDYACSYAASTGSSWIITCNSAGKWVYSSDCGKGVKCTRSKGGAHCGGKQASLEAIIAAVADDGVAASTLTTVTVAAAASAKA